LKIRLKPVVRHRFFAHLNSGSPRKKIIYLQDEVAILLGQIVTNFPFNIARQLATQALVSATSDET
jgi:hypothetical protein